MKKLAIYIPSIESGGVEKNLYYISEYFLKKKIELYIITANYQKKISFNKKIKFICPTNKAWDNSSRLIKNFICLFMIIFKLPKKNTSIFSFQSNISAIILSKILGLKIIIRLNTSLNKYMNSFFKKFFFKLVYNMSDEIIVNSNKFKIELKKILNLNSIKILNPINIKKISKKKINFFSNFKGIKIISIGRLTDQKDQIIILKSLDCLRKKQIRFKLFLIGRGYKLNELKQYVRNNQLLDSVKFAGYKKDAFQYIASSDLFILSSKFEGLPNVLIEAQSQNIPIISSDCPTGPREILLNGKLGTLYKVGDYIALSNAIINFYKNKQIFKKKANLAKKYLYRFDYEKNLNKYYNTIKIIL
jgi:glycosyltransferase involved in cell wall biosynthesis